jgi:predicted deacetylase
LEPENWKRFKSLIEKFQIKPILAIVPENQDSALNFAAPDPEFWQKMREMESEGATIALHGFRHNCVQRGGSLIPLHRETEFAGAPEQQQREWIRAGVEILAKERLKPRLFVAPRHGFDRATLRALKAEGISVLSDGFATRPFVREGVVWIPQQLWGSQEKESGLWTICLHSNTATAGLFAQLEEFLERNSAKFTTIERVLEEYPQTQLSWLESIQARVELAKIRLRRLKKI